MLLKRLLAYGTCFLIFNLNAQTISYDWLDKIGLAKEMLRNVELKHSSKTVTYVQKIKVAGAKGRSKRKLSQIKTTVRKHTDYAWKEAALAIMDMENGNLEIIKIKKDGQGLQNDHSQYNISIEKRPSGLTWNGRNTAFLVTGQDSTYAVIANKWLERLTDGQVKEHIYVPFSHALYQAKLVSGGEKHLKDDISSALYQLGSLGVGSLAFPQKTVANIMSPDYLRNIALNEQTDPQEFYDFLHGKSMHDPFNRVLVLIGANGEEAYAATVSSAKAAGLTQFTKGAWNLVDKSYPDADLKNFVSGAGDHIKSIQAAALLYDYNLARLVKVFGKKILEDKNLSLYIAAAHNCGVDRVIKALKKPGKDWRQALRKLGKTDETIIFLEKMDCLIGKGAIYAGAIAGF